VRHNMDKQPLPKEFLAHTEALQALFARADVDKLQRALERNDLPAACEALGISESGLEWMLRPGQQFADMFAEMFPVVAATIRKQNSTRAD
jgi:hypothetical protein